MDQSTVTQIDQNQNPNPNNQQPPQQSQPQQSDQTATYPPYYTYTPQNAAPIDPNQNPNPSNLDPYYAYYAQFYCDPSNQIRPPGTVESYALASVRSHPHGHTVSYAQYDPATGYYYDTNAQNWAAKEAVRAYGTDPAAAYVNIALPLNGTQQLAVAHPTSTIRSNLSLPRNDTRNRHPKKVKKPKVVKVVQAAFCEVCNVECNTNDILEQHKAGKKHKKKVEKLQAAAATSVLNPSAETSNPVIGPQENPSSEQNKKRSAESPKDLETKRQKLLQGGAAEKAVRTCTLCNVVCNSETVYSYHLAGHKHNAMLKKHAGKVAVPSTT